jgi:inner membrane protein
VRWPTHQLVGALVFEGVITRFHPSFGIGAGCLAAALAGSVVPDLDHLRALLKASFPGSNLGHRTFTHGLLGLAGAAWLAGAAHVPAAVAAAWVGAWAAHLAADCLTPEGCPLLWPVGRRFSLRLVRTGGLLETWVLRPALALLVGMTAVELVKGVI